MVAFISLASAFFFAVGQIWVRIGLQYAPPLSAVAISNAGTALWVWLTLAPFVSFASSSQTGIYLYMFLGVLSPLASQALLFASTLQVGISRASPIRNTAPLFASLLSVAFLGERWTTALVAGTVLIVMGGTLLGMRDSADPHEFKRTYLILPLIGALLGGVSSPLRKFGFSLVPSVPLATCALMAGGMLALLAYLAIAGKYKALGLGGGYGRDRGSSDRHHTALYRHLECALLAKLRKSHHENRPGSGSDLSGRSYLGCV